MTTVILVIGWLVIGVLGLMTQFKKKVKPSWAIYWTTYSMVIITLLERLITSMPK